MKIRILGVVVGLLVTAVAYAQVKVSSLPQLNAGSATFTYGITNSSTDGKVPIGGANGLSYLDGSGFLLPAQFPALTGDCTTVAGAVATTCTKTNGVAFGTSATVNTGTSGANIPLLNGNNTYSGTSTFTGAMSNSVAGAASTPGFSITGVPFAGTGTTSFPQLYVNVSGATASTTLATGGTALGVNGHGTIDLFNLLQDGTSVFKVASTGTLTATGNATFASVTASVSSLTFKTNLVNGNSTHLIMSATAPTISSGFGTSPSIVANNGTAAFTVNVGTGGTASSGVITMPAATTGWACNVTPNAAPQAGAIMYSAPTSTTSITITNYTLSTAAALAWPASAVLQVTCVGY